MKVQQDINRYIFKLVEWEIMDKKGHGHESPCYGEEHVTGMLLNFQVLDTRCVGVDEYTARLDIIAHQVAKC